MELMEFLEKEEKRLNTSLEMHENCVMLCKEDIRCVRNLRQMLLGQPDCETAQDGSRL